MSRSTQLLPRYARASAPTTTTRATSIVGQVPLPLPRHAPNKNALLRHGPRSNPRWLKRSLVCPPPRPKGHATSRAATSAHKLKQFLRQHTPSMACSGNTRRRFLGQCVKVKGWGLTRQGPKSKGQTRCEVDSIPGPMSWWSPHNLRA